MRVPRRRPRGQQHEPAVPFEVDTCDYVVDAGFALLRVSGAGAQPVALAAGADAPHFFEPLPQPGPSAAAGRWQLAFALPVDLVEAGTKLSLADGAGERVELPLPVVEEPAEASAATLTPAPAPAEPAAAAEEDATDRRGRKLVEAWAEAAALRDKLGVRERELAESLTDILVARRELKPLRDRLAIATAEAAELADELSRARDGAREASRRATEAASERDAAVAFLAEAQPRVDAAESAARRSRDEAASLRDTVERLEKELAEALDTAETRREAGEKLEARLEKRERRRRAFGRRSGDSEAADEQQPGADPALAAQEQRIEELEAELHEQASCTEDLRVLLESEREVGAARRDEIQALKRQLEAMSSDTVPAAATETAEGSSAPEPPPWSGIDDELLTRIEKAKALAAP